MALIASEIFRFSQRGKRHLLMLNVHIKNNCSCAIFEVCNVGQLLY